MVCCPCFSKTSSPKNSYSDHSQEAPASRTIYFPDPVTADEEINFQQIGLYKKEIFDLIQNTLKSCPQLFDYTISGRPVFLTLVRSYLINHFNMCSAKAEQLLNTFKIQEHSQEIEISDVLIKSEFKIFLQSFLNHIMCNGKDLSKLNFDSIDLSGKDLSGANLEGSILTRTTNLEKTNLVGVDLTLAIVDGVDVSTAILWEIPKASKEELNEVRAFLKATLHSQPALAEHPPFQKLITSYCIHHLHMNSEKAKSFLNEFKGRVCGIEYRDMLLEVRELQFEAFYLKFIHTIMSHGKNLDRLSFEKARLLDVDLGGASLKGIHFFEASLTGAKLSSANLEFADLRSAILTGANLKNANLSGADLAHALLIQADLTKANLTHADLEKACLVKAVLNEANLTGTDCQEANFVDSLLNDVELTAANMEKAELTNASIRLKFPEIFDDESAIFYFNHNHIRTMGRSLVTAVDSIDTKFFNTKKNLMEAIVRRIQQATNSEKELIFPKLGGLKRILSANQTIYEGQSALIIQFVLDLPDFK